MADILTFKTAKPAPRYSGAAFENRVNAEVDRRIGELRKNLLAFEMAKYVEGLMLEGYSQPEALNFLVIDTVRMQRLHAKVSERIDIGNVFDTIWMQVCAEMAPGSLFQPEGGDA